MITNTKKVVENPLKVMWWEWKKPS